MAVSMWLSWQDQVSLSITDGEAIVSAPGARLSLRSLGPEILAAMQRLTPPGEQEENLEDSILESGSVDSLARWFYHVDQFRQRGLVRRSLHADGKRLVTLEHLRPSAAALSRDTGANGSRPAEGDRVRPDGSSITGQSSIVGQSSTNGPSSIIGDTARQAFILSRFAFVRRKQREFVLESPLAPVRVILHDQLAMSVIAALSTPATVSDVIDRTGGLSPGIVSAFLAILGDAGMIDNVNSEVDSPSSNFDFGDKRTLESWEFHDLMFHSRSRRGRSDGQFGGTYRFDDQPPPPAFKVSDATDWHELYRPDLDQLERDDPPYALVQNRRRSIREYAAQPISRRQLGEFLYRVARVTRVWLAEAPSPPGSSTMDFAARPYPAAGGLHELEFYLIVNACQDLPNGLYHYDVQNHRLGRVSGPTRETELLLLDGATSANMSSEILQVQIVLAARFARLAWKYESIAYSLILKDVGVVYQTMYLAATAMGLAPCGLGCGDSDLFARAAGLNYFVESSVGEFLLGSKK